MNAYAGFRFIEQNSCLKRKQVSFPRSKRRRIRRKWAKDDRRCVTVADPEVYFMGQAKVIVGHPVTLAAFKDMLLLADRPDEWHETMRDQDGRIIGYASGNGMHPYPMEVRRHDLRRNRERPHDDCDRNGADTALTALSCML